MTFRIFLVDDRDDILDHLSHALEEVTDAVVVGRASTQVEAEAWLQKNPDSWDVAVLDLFLSEGSGFGVVKACKDRQAHQRVVVLSNYADVSTADVVAQGADAVFDKSEGLEPFFDYVSARPAR